MVAVVDVPVEFQAYLVRVCVLLRRAEGAIIVYSLCCGLLLYIVENVVGNAEVNLGHSVVGRICIVILLL